MDWKAELQLSLDRVTSKILTDRTENQILGQVLQSNFHKEKLQGRQPVNLAFYNDPLKRNTKLNFEKANEIRRKYNHGEYGKKRLAKEFGVCKAVITRIINNQSWKQES